VPSSEDYRHRRYHVHVFSDVDADDDNHVFLSCRLRYIKKSRAICFFGLTRSSNDIFISLVPVVAAYEVIYSTI